MTGKQCRKLKDKKNNDILATIEKHRIPMISTGSRLFPPFPICLHRLPVMSTAFPCNLFDLHRVGSTWSPHQLDAPSKFTGSPCYTTRPLDTVINLIFQLYP